ncbi:hypothetical protein PDK36_05245 [Bacillus cereus group sp. BcHK104]|uniref:hypothetical protein n=1 Tax=Bacillus cereus group sp. BcHK104 TaxID=3018097 RepID=UPI0022E8FC62|nr:hypothetical protein [Bacillus cereus group sp. BcHK104]MDA1987227.1 hypothetical protein [Bacillus cereus group sp. BcHK104]
MKDMKITFSFRKASGLTDFAANVHNSIDDVKLMFLPRIGETVILPDGEFRVSEIIHDTRTGNVEIMVENI